MRRPLSITMDKVLPPRARGLGADAMARVFGGCVGAYHPCQTTADCCPGRSDATTLWCTYNGANGTRTCRYA